MDIRDSIVVDTVPPCSLSILMVGIMLYISVNTRIDSLDIVPSCSLSILMVGIKLIFSWI